MFGLFLNLFVCATCGIHATDLVELRPGTSSTDSATYGWTQSPEHCHDVATIRSLAEDVLLLQKRQSDDLVVKVRKSLTTCRFCATTVALADLSWAWHPPSFLAAVQLPATRIQI